MLKGRWHHAQGAGETLPRQQNPNVKQFISNTQYSKALQIVADNEALLSKLLEGKEKKLFLGLQSAQSEINNIKSLECFIEGFRLGARLGIEVIDSGDGCFVDIDWAYHRHYLVYQGAALPVPPASISLSTASQTQGIAPADIAAAIPHASHLEWVSQTPRNPKSAAEVGAVLIWTDSPWHSRARIFPATIADSLHQAGP